MIKIVTSRKLAALRAEAALVPALKAEAGQVPGLRESAAQSAQAFERAASELAAAKAGQARAEAALAAAVQRSSAASPAKTAAPRPPAPTAPEKPARREIIRKHLDRILATPAPANHSDHLRDRENYDGTAASRQLEQVRILQMLHGHDEVAIVYQQWLDNTLAGQAKTAEPLRSWNEIAIDAAPIGWGQRDRHGFLCLRCGECDWQVVTIGDIEERLCGRCAREMHMEPGKVWAPRTPPAEGHIACPGLLPDEPHENSIDASLADDGTRNYPVGDANAFIVDHHWMGMDTSGHLAGSADRPRMEITGSTGAEGHKFSFIITLEYDPAPQGFRKNPYGFRYVSGTLTSHGETCAVTDPFELLDTIALGEAEYPVPAPA